MSSRRSKMRKEGFATALKIFFFESRKKRRRERIRFQDLPLVALLFSRGKIRVALVAGLI